MPNHFSGPDFAFSHTRAKSLQWLSGRRVGRRLMANSGWPEILRGFGWPTGGGRVARRRINEYRVSPTLEMVNALAVESNQWA